MAQNAGDGDLTILIWLVWVFIAIECIVTILWIWGLGWLKGALYGTDSSLLPLPDQAPDPDAPSLAIFIAAQNEEDKIIACLERILAQNYSNMRIVVVNDRSADSTPDKVRSVMAKHARVELVNIDELPAGWIGKTHALAVAARDVSADYLLFIDGDCRLAPGAIAATMKKAIRGRIDFLSLMPSLELKTFWERVLTPPAAWLLGLFAAMGVRRTEVDTQMRLGNGQFMLFSREGYEAIGGHKAVSAELAEDLAMARLAADAGLRCWTGAGKGLYVTSRTNGWSGTVNALTRVLIGSLASPWRILASTQLLSGGIVTPIWLLPLSVGIAYYLAIPEAWALAAVCMLHLILILSTSRTLFEMLLEKPPRLSAFLFGSIICTGVVVWAWIVISGWGKVRWGKTTYRVRGSCVVEAQGEREHALRTR